MILVALLVVCVILLYLILIRPYRYWSDRGVKQIHKIYLLGDDIAIMFRKESLFDMMLRVYKAFPEERYVGLYQGMHPNLLIRDPEIIKQVTVKEFDHFLNHRSVMPDGIDPLWSRNLVALKDTQWRDMRSTLSPSFTSSKMRIIFSLISECADTYLIHFMKKEATVTVELKDILSRYTNDAIATVAFGIKCDSINEKNNEFFLMGKRTMTLSVWTILAITLYSTIPSLAKLLQVKLFPEHVRMFFVNLVKETINIRLQKNIVRPDMINQLLEARRGKKQDIESSNNITDTGFATVEESSIHATHKPVKETLTDIDIAAQAMIFFGAGFESVATLMSFLGYELTVNPDIQEKLQAEIDTTLKECNGKLTYEALMRMKYMDMVVSEALRKWPVAISTDRVCSKAFTIDPVKPHEKPVHLKPNDLIQISLIGIHRDSKYYPNPNKFDPERFSDENKANIKPYTYLPFGLGPRNCIGSRLALLETKTLFFYMLSKFNFVPNEKTQIPIGVSKTIFSLTAEKGIWVNLQPRYALREK